MFTIGLTITSSSHAAVRDGVFVMITNATPSDPARRRNVLNGASLNLVAFNRYNGLVNLDGQITSLFIIVLAAAEAALAVAICMNYYKNLSTIDVDAATRWRGEHARVRNRLVSEWPSRWRCLSCWRSSAPASASGRGCARGRRSRSASPWRPTCGGWLAAGAERRPNWPAPREPLRAGFTVAGHSVPVLFKVKLDSLTVMMYLMVTLVSTCIFVFPSVHGGHSDEWTGSASTTASSPTVPVRVLDARL